MAKKLTKLLTLGVALIMGLGLFAGCGGNTVKQGKYVIEDGTAWILLSDEKTFAFERGIVTSYRPTGNYTVKNNALTLYFDEEKWVFGIKQDCLVFEKAYYNNTLISKDSDFSKTFFSIGTKFKLSENE